MKYLVLSLVFSIGSIAGASNIDDYYAATLDLNEARLQRAIAEQERHHTIWQARWELAQLGYASPIEVDAAQLALHAANERLTAVRRYNVYLLQLVPTFDDALSMERSTAHSASDQPRTAIASHLLSARGKRLALTAEEEYCQWRLTRLQAADDATRQSVREIELATLSLSVAQAKRTMQDAKQRLTAAREQLIDASHATPSLIERIESQWRELQRDAELQTLSQRTRFTEKYAARCRKLAELGAARPGESEAWQREAESTKLLAAAIAEPAFSYPVVDDTLMPTSELARLHAAATSDVARLIRELRGREELLELGYAAPDEIARAKRDLAIARARIVDLNEQQELNRLQHQRNDAVSTRQPNEDTIQH